MTILFQKNQPLLTCARCGTKLVQEEKNINGVREAVIGLELEYNIIMTCPKRLGTFYFFYVRHDRKHFDGNGNEFKT